MGKKKLSNMNVDEFIQHGFDSDVDDEQIGEVKKTLKKIKKKKKSKTEKSESESHKKQLDNLKDKDPEFFKFLQENDAGLLEFSGSENELSDSQSIDENESSDENDGDDDDDSSDDDDKNDADVDDNDDVNNDEIHSEETASADENVSDSDGNDKIEDKKEKKSPKILTHDKIKEWKIQLENDNLKVLKQVLAALSSAVHDISPDEEKDEKETKKPRSKPKKYKVDGGSMFNALVAMSFKHSFRILEKHLDYNKKTKHNKRKLLPSSSKKWSGVKNFVKQYLFDILQILRQLSEATVLAAVLHHCQSLIPYYATFPKLCKMFLKRLVRMWSTGHENVRVLSFIALRRTILLKPNLFEYLVKKMYLAFVRNSKFVTLKSKVVLQFMENSVIEMYSMNHSIAYQHGFLYIRQLAINLRNAITVKKKESYQVVYNWQYVSCLQLWCRLISEHHDDILQPLIYPLVEITLGVIRLSNSVRYYPLRFTCIKLLNLISEKTGVYIPTATNILQAVESKELNKKPSTSEKPPDFYVVLKLSKSQASSKSCQDLIVDLAFETMLRHYVIYSNSIAFPELIFPICHRLKRLTKETKVVKLCKDMRTLVDKLQKHADFISKERSRVTFSPRDVDKVRDWEETQKQKQNILKEFEKTWLAMKERVEDPNTEVIEDTAKENQNRKRKSSNKKNKSFEEESNEKNKKRKTSANNDEIAEKTMKNRKSKSKKKHQSEDDVLEDFKFSESESE